MVQPPSLDFLSPEFNALEALRTEGLQPPNPRVRPLDNLNKCRRILSRELPESLANVPVREPRSQESIAAQQRAKARTSLVSEKAAKRARQSRILDILADKLTQGPLSLLVECYEQKIRVQIWTRHTHGIRGTMVGFVRALDNHFYMVLQDVDEQYTVLRRVPRLVRKRGRVQTLHSQEKTAQSSKVDGVHECMEKQEKQGGPSSQVESLVKEMKELRLFPKLEQRRRHLNCICSRRQCGHDPKAGVGVSQWTDDEC